MDRLYGSMATGNTVLVDLNRFTAESVIRENAPETIHPKMKQRAALERCGIPTNEHYYLAWRDRWLLEAIVEHVTWPNLGANTLLSKQSGMGRTPLIMALPMMDMRRLWAMKLGELEKAVREFKLRNDADPEDTDSDFIRCYTSPVLEPGYLGLTVVCETHQYDHESPVRMPYHLEVCGQYPRYIQTAEVGTFLSMSVSKNGAETVKSSGEERFEQIVPKVRMFVRENAGNITRLAANLEADVVSLDMEWVPPDWLRVFDVDPIPLPMAAKIEAQLPPIKSSEPQPRFAS